VIRSFGDRALRFAIPGGISPRALLEALQRDPAFDDVVLTEELGAVLLADATDEPTARGALSRILGAAQRGEAPPSAVRSIEIPVVYDGEDLAAVAELARAAAADVVRMHSAPTYEVAMLGFMPGFAYLRGGDPQLAIARRASPRTRVPPRSVAMAADYTGIYPFASPGGWHLLGEAVRFRPFSAERAALAVGDRVRFVPEPRRTTDPVSPGEHLGDVVTPRVPALAVTRVHGMALVVDDGRRGHMHEGVPRGGPLVGSALGSANAAVGNAPGAAALEVYGAVTLVARGGAVVVATEDGAPVTIAENAQWELAPNRAHRARYVAVAGGIDVPVVLGGRGTLLVAALGGHRGRALRRGDVLPVGHASGVASSASAEPGYARGDAPIALMLGPDDVPAELAAALERTTFRISTSSDRTGTRLEGASLPPMHSAHGSRSAPMVAGAIEVTPSGLIVLGPDHPVTGGYPVVGVLPARARDAFGARPLGSEVRFSVTQ